MAQKISKKYKLDIKGVLSFDGDRPIVSVEDRGEFDFIELMRDFEDREISVAVSFDEDYTAPEVDDNGEVIDL